MANEFSKEEKVAFDQLLEGFNDQLILTLMMNRYNVDGVTMERTSDVIWRPMPYIMNSYDGQDQTGNFLEKGQMSVPVTVGYEKSVPWLMSATELRDALQEKRLGEAAKQRLASDINVAGMTVAALQGTIVIPIAGASSSSTLGGYNAVSQADAYMNEIGVMMDNRHMALSSRDYNGMASDLAARQTMGPKVTGAYERSYVGNVAGFNTVKLDYANRITAAAGTCNISGANQYYTPKATSIAATGERSNVDNRYQTITVDDGTDVVAGDCFTVADVYAVHLITKQSTGQLKTFRVIEVSGNNLKISPPFISGGGGTQPEIQYQNVDSTPADGAALTFLNTDAAAINPFWHKDALEIIPSGYSEPMNAGAAILKATSDQGIEISMEKFYDINTKKIKYRCDVRFGIGNKQPEMTGIMIFGQTS